MKLLILSVAITCQLSPLASRAVCQESRSQPERLHFAFSFPQGHKVLFELTATSAQRVLSSSVLQLTGNVEVRMTTCPPQGHVCVTSPMVLHADAVDYNEATGQIAAHGDVHTTFIELSPRGHRPQGYEPEPLQRPVLARAGSVATQ
jgi:lipopolysaccharide assembly outer membrane protein LptD (OstA)